MEASPRLQSSYSWHQAGQQTKKPLCVSVHCFKFESCFKFEAFLLDQFKSLSSSSATEECFIEEPNSYPVFDTLVRLCSHGVGSLLYGTRMHTSMGLLSVNDVVDYFRPGSASAIPCIAKLFFSAVSFTTSRKVYYAMLQVMHTADGLHWVLTDHLIVAKHW